MNLSIAITQYIDYRQSLGEKFKTNGNLLRQFHKYLGTDMPLLSITETITTGFLYSGQSVVSRKWFTRHTALFGFFRWCVARGHLSEIPLTKDKPNAPSRIEPYIYSDEELARLFLSAMTYQKRPTIIYPECVRAILQLTYVLGLRISETMNLRMKDVDLINCCITIHESKFYTSRIVTFNEDVKTLIEKFFSWRKDNGMSSDDDTSLWITRSGSTMKLSCMNDIFERIRIKAGVCRNDNTRYQPRMHDLRHTFAVNRLRIWYQSGKDVQSLLPVLSAYLGHKQVSYTTVYLTLTPGLLSDASNLFLNMQIQKRIKMNDKAIYLSYWVKRYLSDYMLTAKNLSRNTVRSYRDTFRLLVCHLRDICKKNPDKLQLQELTTTIVSDFLDKQQTTRKVSIATRNQRLAAIHAFAKYVAMNSPEHMEWCRNIRNIPKKKAPRKMITYLEKTEMDALLALPDQNPNRADATTPLCSSYTIPAQGRKKRLT